MVTDAASVRAILRALMPELCEKFGVVRLALFGSVARGKARPDSDIDVLVGFSADARPTFFRLAEMEALLESVLGRKIDAVPEDSLSSRIASYIHPSTLLCV